MTIDADHYHHHHWQRPLSAIIVATTGNSQRRQQYPLPATIIVAANCHRPWPSMQTAAIDHRQQCSSLAIIVATTDNQRHWRYPLPATIIFSIKRQWRGFKFDVLHYWSWLYNLKWAEMKNEVFTFFTYTSIIVLENVGGDLPPCTFLPRHRLVEAPCPLRLLLQVDCYCNFDSYSSCRSVPLLAEGAWMG